MNGLKASPTRAVLEQILRPGVRRCHHHHAVGEQCVEQSAQDHRIRDVADLELVEAEQTGLCRNRARQRRYRVGHVRICALQRMQLAMHVLHEAVEMDAALARHRRPLEEQVHQHGFAAADLAHDIKAAWRLGSRRRKPEQPPENPRTQLCPRWRLVGAQRLEQAVEPYGDLFLLRIRLDQALCEALAVGGKRPSHDRPPHHRPPITGLAAAASAETGSAGSRGSCGGMPLRHSARIAQDQSTNRERDDNASVRIHLSC